MPGTGSLPLPESEVLHFPVSYPLRDPIHIGDECAAVAFPLIKRHAEQMMSPYLYCHKLTPDSKGLPLSVLF